MADDIRLPFLRTLYAGDASFGPSSRLRGSSPAVQRRVLNLLLALLFPIERSGCSLCKITLKIVFWGCTNSFPFFRHRRNSCYISPCGTIGWIPVFWRFFYPRQRRGRRKGRKFSALLDGTQRRRSIQWLFVHAAVNVIPEGNLDCNAAENRRNHQVAGVAKLASVEVWAAVLFKEDMMVSPGAGNVKRWNRLKEGGMDALFDVIRIRPTTSVRTPPCA